ncbi:helix-turn-helix domain-containing protein [Agathobaculum sp. LCP25S3_E8]|uniref:helix-turn-helix domain-containing protein n=1 Tax=Agathobaculum sp. LCP25S3_E8 TaxID=3438735 RepID=UPI003F8FE864
MVRLNVLLLLEKKGKTKYWLYKQLGMSYQNFNRMVNNQTSSIKLERIETLCQLLDCTPNDLFIIDWEEHDTSK